MEHIPQILLLLGIAVAVVVVFQRLHVPTSLGYLLVGVILGPHTVGPTVYVPEFDTLAEFGLVFLLFTIGLNFSLPQLHAMRHEVLWLGTGQVVLTTAVVAAVMWFVGFPAASAFVIGAVFAQSSTTIIGRGLAEQGEENTPHGRFGLAMSVFQDVTAVPFLVIIPALGVAASADRLAGALGWALAKAAVAFALIFFVGRWLLRPLFHAVAERRSAEVFTLAVLLVALLAAWTTNSFGLSLAFGGFLAGMMLGETEFRHQVELSISPFRDVLLGLFFVGIGMRFDPLSIPPIAHWVVLGALLVLVSKTLLVTALVRLRGVDSPVAWRTGLLLAVGGEFGFALVAIASDANVIDMELGQIAMTSVLLAMIGGAFLIRWNDPIAKWLIGDDDGEAPNVAADLVSGTQPCVVIGGYGRVGHTVAILLQSREIPIVVLDTDPQRVQQGRAEGLNVHYGDIADRRLLEVIGVGRARLVVITIDRSDTALQAVSLLRDVAPHVPVIARARDLETSARLLQAGATHAYPEAIEASLRLGAAALQTLSIASEDIDQLIRDVRDRGYKPVLEPERDQ